MDQSNERPAIYWLLNIVHWLRSCKLYLQYGDIGCGVSNSGIQNYVDFLPENELIPRKFWYFLKWNNAKPTLFLQNKLFHKWLIWKIILSKNWTGICFKMLLWLKDCNICCWKSKFPDFSKDKLFSLNMLMLLSKIYLILYPRAWNSTTDISIIEKLIIVGKIHLLKNVSDNILHMYNRKIVTAKDFLSKSFFSIWILFLREK